MFQLKKKQQYNVTRLCHYVITNLVIKHASLLVKNGKHYVLTLRIIKSIKIRFLYWKKPNLLYKITH